VLEIFRRSPEDELVVELTVVAQHEPDLLVLFDLNPVRQEQHLAFGFGHRDLNNPGRLCRIAWFAGSISLGGR
jgi:hypothetical protein